MVWARGARCVTVFGGLLGALEVVFVDAWLPGSPYDTMFSTSEIKLAPMLAIIHAGIVPGSTLARSKRVRDPYVC